MEMESATGIKSSGRAPNSSGMRPGVSCTMNALHILSTYQWLRENPNAEFTPHTYIFGAKAAPGYYFAKQMIRFIVELGNTINNDPLVNQKMKVVYIEDYRVTLAELLTPAADLSEQISLAGTEASGTSNMAMRSAFFTPNLTGMECSPCAVSKS